MALIDFLLVGAARSGTTSLYQYLCQHPAIFMSHLKEPMFFAYAHQQNKPAPVIKNIRDYGSLFAAAGPDQVKGEASVCYLYLYKNTIANIKRFIPDCQKLKIVIVLRNPCQRAFSHYWFYKMSGIETLSFLQAINNNPVKRLGQEKKGLVIFDYLKTGFYFNQVRAWLENFPQTRIYLYDDLEKNPVAMMADLYSFLGVDAAFQPDLSKRFNVSGMGWEFRGLSLLKDILRPTLTSPLGAKLFLKFNNLRGKKIKPIPLDQEAKELLVGIYREDILRLQNLIKRDLSSWLNQ